MLVYLLNEERDGGEKCISCFLFIFYIWHKGIHHILSLNSDISVFQVKTKNKKQNTRERKISVSTNVKKTYWGWPTIS